MTTLLTYSTRQIKLLFMAAMLLTLTTTTLMVSVILTQWQNSNGCIHVNYPTAFCKCDRRVEGEIPSEVRLVRLLSDTTVNKTRENARFLSENEKVSRVDISTEKFDPLQDRPKTRPKVSKENGAVFDGKRIFPWSRNGSVGTIREIMSTGKSTESTRKPTVKTLTSQPLIPRNDTKVLGLLGGKPVPSAFAWKADIAMDKCKSPGPILLILVHSARENFERRRIIRKTWGSVKIYRSWRVILVFLVGAKDASEGPEVLKSMENEYFLTGDIAKKAAFIDSSRNIVHKHVMGYEWASTFCPQASFVIKSDDHIMIDLFKLIDWITTREKADTNIYYCQVSGNSEPDRDPSSKSYVSEAEYSKRVFPKYCSGGAYATSMNVIKMVTRALIGVPQVRLDNVYVTGLGPEEVNRILISRSQNQSLILHADRSEEYIYFNWERQTGMALIRDWCESNLNFSPWTFFLVEHGPRYHTDCKHIWEKICAVHNYA